MLKLSCPKYICYCVSCTKNKVLHSPHGPTIVARRETVLSGELEHSVTPSVALGHFWKRTLAPSSVQAPVAPSLPWLLWANRLEPSLTGSFLMLAWTVPARRLVFRHTLHVPGRWSHSPSTLINPAPFVFDSRISLPSTRGKKKHDQYLTYLERRFLRFEIGTKLTIARYCFRLLQSYFLASFFTSFVCFLLSSKLAQPYPVWHKFFRYIAIGFSIHSLFLDHPSRRKARHSSDTSPTGRPINCLEC